MSNTQSPAAVYTQITLGVDRSPTEIAVIAARDYDADPSAVLVAGGGLDADEIAAAIDLIDERPPTVEADTTKTSSAAAPAASDTETPAPAPDAAGTDAEGAGSTPDTPPLSPAAAALIAESKPAAKAPAKTPAKKAPAARKKAAPKA